VVTTCLAFLVSELDLNGAELGVVAAGTAHSGAFELVLVGGQYSDPGVVVSHTASGAMAARRSSSSISVRVYGVQVLVSVVTRVQKSPQQSIVCSVEMGTMMLRSMQVAPSSSRT
jgi:hypothetical protein